MATTTIYVLGGLALLATAAAAYELLSGGGANAGATSSSSPNTSSNSAPLNNATNPTVTTTPTATQSTPTYITTSTQPSFSAGNVGNGAIVNSFNPVYNNSQSISTPFQNTPTSTYTSTSSSLNYAFTSNTPNNSVANNQKYTNSTGGLFSGLNTGGAAVSSGLFANLLK